MTSLISKSLSGNNRLQNIILNNTQIEDTLTPITSNSVNLGSSINPFNNLFANNISSNTINLLNNSINNLSTNINTSISNIATNINTSISNINTSITNLKTIFNTTNPLCYTSSNTTFGLKYDNETIKLNSSGSLVAHISDFVNAKQPLSSKNWADYLTFLGFDINTIDDTILNAIASATGIPVNKLPNTLFMQMNYNANDFAINSGNLILNKTNYNTEKGVLFYQNSLLQNSSTFLYDNISDKCTIGSICLNNKIITPSITTGTLYAGVDDNSNHTISGIVNITKKLLTYDIIATDITIDNLFINTSPQVSITTPSTSKTLTSKNYVDNTSYITVDNTLAKTGSQLSLNATLKTKYDGYQAQIDAVVGDVGALDTTVAEHTVNLTTLNAGAVATGISITGIGIDLGIADSNINVLKHIVDNVGGSGVVVAQSSNQLVYNNSITHNITTLQVSSFTYNTTDMNTIITNTNSSIASCNTSINNIISSINALPTYSSINTTINSLITNFNSSIGNAYSCINSLITNFNSSIGNLSITSLITNFNSSIGNTYSSINSLINNFNISIGNTNTSINSLITNFNISIGNANTSINNLITNFNSSIGNANTSINSLKTNFNISIGNANTSINNLINNFNVSIGNANTSISNLKTNFTTTNAVITNVSIGSGYINGLTANCNYVSATQLIAGSSGFWSGYNNTLNNTFINNLTVGNIQFNINNYDNYYLNIYTTGSTYLRLGCFTADGSGDVLQVSYNPFPTLNLPAFTTVSTISVGSTITSTFLTSIFRMGNFVQLIDSYGNLIITNQNNYKSISISNDNTPYITNYGYNTFNNSATFGSNIICNGLITTAQLVSTNISTNTLRVNGDTNVSGTVFINNTVSSLAWSSTFSSAFNHCMNLYLTNNVGGAGYGGGTIALGDTNHMIFGRLGYDGSNSGTIDYLAWSQHRFFYTSPGSATQILSLSSSGVSTGNFYCPTIYANNINSNVYLNLNDKNGQTVFQANGSSVAVGTDVVPLQLLGSKLYSTCNFGLGTYYPSFILDIYADTAGDSTRIQNANSSGYASVCFTNPSGTYYMGHGGSSSYSRYQKNFYITQSYGGNDYIFNGTGLGINTPPSYPLHINSYYYSTGWTGSYFSSGTGTSIYTGTVAENVSLYATGSIISGQNFQSVSDIRIKKNISNITGATAIIKSLTPKTYQYKDKIKNAKYTNGFIAHEVKQVLPTAVGQHTQILPDLMVVATSANTLNTIGSVLIIPDTSILTKNSSGNYLPVEVFYNNDQTQRIKCNVLNVSAGNIQLDTTLKENLVYLYGHEHNDVLNINYNEIIAIAVQAIKELEQRISDLEAKNKNKP
jgi:hypothetical protein